MDHVRRKFEYALSNDPQRATYVLDIMKEWYKVEEEARKNEYTLDERFAHRVAATIPSMQEFKVWLKSQLSEVLPKSAIGMAISYAYNQWPFFEPFMTDPRVELSTILTENKIRPVAIGRKNYLFKGSHEAAQRAAMIYSLVTIAKNYEIDPHVYIKDILIQLPASKNINIDKMLIPEWVNPKNVSSEYFFRIWDYRMLTFYDHSNNQPNL